MSNRGRLRLSTAISQHLPLVLIVVAWLLSTSLHLHVPLQLGAASYTDGAAIFNPPATTIAATLVSSEFQTVDTTGVVSVAPAASTSLVESIQGTPVASSTSNPQAVASFHTRMDDSSLLSSVTMSSSWTSTAAAPASTPTLDELPDAPLLFPAHPFSESVLMTDDPESIWQSPITPPYSFVDDFQERYGWMRDGYQEYDFQDEEGHDLEQPRQQGYTSDMSWTQSLGVWALDPPRDTQTHQQSWLTTTSTVIDPRVGMSVPAAGIVPALQACAVPPPIAPLPPTTMINNAVPSQINLPVNPDFEIKDIPDEVWVVVMQHLFVYPGQEIHVTNMKHPSGEPILQVRMPGQRNANDICLPPLEGLLAMARANSWRLRNLALEQFFGHNFFDLSSDNSLKWLNALPEEHLERLARVRLSFNLGRVTYYRCEDPKIRKLIKAVGKSCKLEHITVKVQNGLDNDLTGVQRQQLFRVMPGLGWLSRLRGVQSLVIEAPSLSLEAAEVRRLEACLSKPKGRQGSKETPHHPALALKPLTVHSLRQKDSAFLDNELESFGLNKADYKTKVSKAIELARLRRLDWKNPEEP